MFQLAVSHSRAYCGIGNVEHWLDLGGDRSLLAKAIVALNGPV